MHAADFEAGQSEQIALYCGNSKVLADDAWQIWSPEKCAELIAH